MMARKPSLGSNAQPRLFGRGPGLASIGSDGPTERRVILRTRREGESLERNRDGVTAATVSDDRGAVAHANEPGASASVHHSLVRLKGAGRAELQLQELRTGDRVQSQRVHAPTPSAGPSLVLPGTAGKRRERRLPESNRCTGFCRPMPNHSAKAPPGRMVSRCSGRARPGLRRARE